jgi:hypothetical protein
VGTKKACIKTVKRRARKKSFSLFFSLLCQFLVSLISMLLMLVGVLFAWLGGAFLVPA